MNERLDWSECATEYGLSRQRISELVASAPASVLGERVQACPDWTVKDVCAHLAGVPAALVAGDIPQGNTDAWVAAQVADRSDRSADELLDEWEAVAAPFQEMMATRGGGVAGLLLDVVAHEHDLRHTLDRPGARDSRGVALSMGFTRFLMDGDLKRCGAGPVQVASRDGTWRAGGADGDELTLVLDLAQHPEGTFELFRLLGSRRSERQVATAPWQGDWEAARAGLFHMPLPVDDLIE